MTSGNRMNSGDRMTNSAPTNAADWIAVDWGTSRMRAWAMSDSGDILARSHSEQGMNSLAPEQFETTLLQQISGWLATGCKTPVIACGMVGSRQGWVEATYQALPCPPAGLMTIAPVTSPQINVHLCPGIKQLSPADVMRGEETQVAGLLATEPDFDGVICLPGTHSKWVRVKKGQIFQFQTFMTGELFALLAEQSVLRHSMPGSGWDSSGWDSSAFAQGLAEAIEQPATVSAKLFSLRAESLLDGLKPEVARARLSGFLIGLELSATRSYWSGQAVAIIGAGTLAAHYAQALATQGTEANIYDGESMTLKGLTAAYRHLTGV